MLKRKNLILISKQTDITFIEMTVIYFPLLFLIVPRNISI